MMASHCRFLLPCAPASTRRTLFVATCLLRQLSPSEATRLFKRVIARRSTSTAQRSDSPCTGLAEKECLAKGSNCMFLQFEGSDAPSCLPCTQGAAPVPCPPEKSLFGASKVVKKCDMTCAHQAVLTKVSDCTDVSSFTVTRNQCMAKGDASGTKCMFVSYQTGAGDVRNVCGPCEVGGVGTIACYAAGNQGPEAGSTVVDCVSKCEEAWDEDTGMPCGGVTPCFPTPKPPAEIVVTGVDAFGVKPKEGAPTYFAAHVPAPYSAADFKAASEAAAAAAGWWPSIEKPPTAPVLVWGGAPANSTGLPADVTPYWAPAPPGVPGLAGALPAPGTGYLGVLPDEPLPA
ncbi:unnamed protein product [Amoebophrya sp. A25]|nr:unnamed protein product [Amoebophrya sp. A25]|eukprot:GSA25T00007059001.1